ncbi:MAG: hypothetical protein AAF804_07220 [Bacteroidota bacterium]
MRALVMEYEDDILDLLEYNLTKAGFEVLVCDQSEDLVALALTYDPHLILIGNWRGIEGQLGVYEDLKAQYRPSRKDTLMVFLSTQSEEWPQASLGRSMELILPAPIKPKELIRLIQRSLVLQ